MVLMVRGAAGRLTRTLHDIGYRVSNNKQYKKLIAFRFTIPVVVFVLFFGVSLATTQGPAYLSDEVGYLAKAATIAGSPVQLATSWFGGYSLMISPAFIISSDPYISWYIVLFLNALMWAGSALLLQYVVRRIYPQASPSALFVAVLGAMLYPSWVSMSGYAFATSGFVLVFVAVLAAILKSNFSSFLWLSVAAALAGYLAWIHPLGFLCVGLFAITSCLQAVLRKRPELTLPAVISLGLGITYVLAIHPYLNQLMSGSIGNDGHYAETVGGLSQAIFTGQYWLHVLGLMAGFTLFALIATFGLAAFGIMPVIQRLIANRRSWHTYLQDTPVVVALMCVALLIGYSIFNALSWGAASQLRIDQWVYGRYTDMYILPIICFGLLMAWKRKHIAYAAGGVLISGIILTVLTNPSNTSVVFNNKVNVQSLWSMHVASLFHANNYMIWAIIGALGIAVWCLLAEKRRRLFIPLLLLPILMTGAANTLYRHTIVDEHAYVSSIYSFIKDHYTKAQCIGFTPDPDSNERFNLYSYYLHGYNIKKMSYDQWQTEGCSGPYLTYDHALAAIPSLQLTGVEQGSDLRMYTKKDSALANVPDPELSPIISKDDLSNYGIIFR